MRLTSLNFSCFLILLSCVSCKTFEEDITVEPAIDIHTYSDPGRAVTTHLDLEIEADFETRVLLGKASYLINTSSGTEEIVFDVNQLTIDSIFVHRESGMDEVSFQIGDSKPFMGAPLTIPIDSLVVRIDIYYQTDPEASALQWLEPQQTHDKTHPFLFTQGQAILTRTWIPCQDGPGIRFTYNAVVKVPPPLLALMSASNPTSRNDEGIYHFEMTQPIPAYLMALAIGSIEFAPVGERTGVYAEPGLLEASAYEFADMEKMLLAAERLYGPYLWDRYDLIVLPPSFPFGGMENPRLTFATPTIIAGDRSLTALVAHELAHSWSGNLVTNATWEDFWLNEGFTNYFERRIMEDLYGKEYTDMLWLLGFQDLQSTIEDLGPDHPDTHLKLQLAGRDPDDGMTDIAYEKGSLLLRTLEEEAGREVFDAFLMNYFQEFKFKSISTDAWIAYANRHLLKPNKLQFDLDLWIHGPGIPDRAVIPESSRLRNVDQRQQEFVRIGRLDASQGNRWSTHEWLHFLRHLPRDLHLSFYEKLDDVFDLSASGNSEILAEWLEISIESGYLEDHNKHILEDFLLRVGRRKFLTPLYSALLEHNQIDLAKEIFEKARPNYHSVSANTVAGLIQTATEVG